MEALDRDQGITEGGCDTTCQVSKQPVFGLCPLHRSVCRHLNVDIDVTPQPACKCLQAG